MIKLLREFSYGYRWALVGIIFLGILSIATSLSTVWLSKHIIDVVTAPEPSSWKIPGAIFIGTLALSALLRLAGLSLSNHTAVKLGNAARLRIFSHLLYTRWQSLKDLHSGDMLTRIIKDTDETIHLLISSIPTAIISLLQLLASLLMLYIFDPILAMILGIGMPLMLISSRAFYRKMLGFSKGIKETESDINSQIQEALSNQTVIRTFERQEEEINRLELMQIKLYKRIRDRVGLTIYGNIMASAAFTGGYAIAFLWSAWGLLKGTITFGTMTSFLQLVVRIQKPLGDLMSLIPSIISAKASADRLEGIFQFQTERQQRSSIFKDPIRLSVRNIYFRYDENSPFIYKDFNLEVASGEMIAIMGQTGVGKTTLLRLLLGLVNPEKGTITLCSEHREECVNESTRNNFVYVPQGSSLFSGTIRENLLVGDNNADDKRLKQVLDIAEAQFVWELPEGLDCTLGERGAGLSEGQAQRIAIARSLLRPGRILLFDEATSALDEDTEERLLHKLRQHLEGRIILFITHHHKVATLCDQIIHI